MDQHLSKIVLPDSYNCAHWSNINHFSVAKGLAYRLLLNDRGYFVIEHAYRDAPVYIAGLPKLTKVKLALRPYGPPRAVDEGSAGSVPKFRRDSRKREQMPPVDIRRPIQEDKKSG